MGVVLSVTDKESLISQHSSHPDPVLAAAGRRFQMHLLGALVLLALIWTVKMVEITTGQSLTSWGLYPRDLKGLIGIITMPFIHGDMDHLFNNTPGVLFLSLGTFHFYRKIAPRVMIYSVLIGNLLVWLFARESYHIGASGLVYSLSAFLFFSGVMRRDKQSTGAAMIVALLYGGAIWGLFPFQQGVSWEGHLFGAVAGTYLAFWYRHVDTPVVPLNDGTEESPHEMQLDTVHITDRQLGGRL